MILMVLSLVSVGCSNDAGDNHAGTNTATRRDDSRSEVVAAMPSGDPSIEIRDVLIAKSEKVGYHSITMECRFITGAHGRKWNKEDFGYGNGLMLVVQHGSDTVSRWLGNPGDGPIYQFSGTVFLAPSGLPALTDEESELVWPVLKSVDVWIGVHDPHATDKLRRVSQILKVVIPDDASSLQPSKCSGHEVYEDRSRHIAEAVKIGKVRWAPPHIEFDISGCSEGIYSLTVEMEVEIENKTKGYKWIVKEAFYPCKCLFDDMHPGHDIEVGDVLEARILSRRVLRWVDIAANEYVRLNRISGTFNTRTLSDYERKKPWLCSW